MQDNIAFSPKNNVSTQGCIGRWMSGDIHTHVWHYSPRPPNNSHRTHCPQVVHRLPFGICVLTDGGYTVQFDNKKCVVQYKEKTILIGMKDPATDLWTLPIVGPAGKTSRTGTTEEQDPFVNLHKEFLETTSKASISNELVLAISVCASAQACVDGGKATPSLKKNPPSNQLPLKNKYFFTNIKVFLRTR